MARVPVCKRPENVKRSRKRIHEDSRTGQTGLKPLDEMSVLPSTLVLSDAATEPVIPSSNSYHNSELSSVQEALNTGGVTRKDQKDETMLGLNASQNVMEPLVVIKPTCRRYCSVPNCRMRAGKMFFFPRNKIMREHWKSCCNIERTISDTMNICIRHFKEADLYESKNGRIRVKKGAVPSECLRIEKMPLPVKGRRYCIVPGCGLKESDGVTLHILPRNVQRRTQWQNICRLPKLPCRCRHVCSQHFKKSDYIMKDGKQKLRWSVCPSKLLPDCLPIVVIPDKADLQVKPLPDCVSDDEDDEDYQDDNDGNDESECDEIDADEGVEEQRLCKELNHGSIHAKFPKMKLDPGYACSLLPNDHSNEDMGHGGAGIDVSSNGIQTPSTYKSAELSVSKTQKTPGINGTAPLSQKEKFNFEDLTPHDFSTTHQAKSSLELMQTAMLKLTSNLSDTQAELRRAVQRENDLRIFLQYLKNGGLVSEKVASLIMEKLEVQEK